MGRAIVISAGPLAAASANNIATSQKAAISGANVLVLDGTTTDAASTGVCASQSPTAAAGFTLNGTYATTDKIAGFGGTDPNAQASIVRLPAQRNIYFTCAADESAKTVTITGTQYGPNTFGQGIVVSETLTLANTSKVCSAKTYNTIISISISSNSAGAITVGMNGVATLDNARRVLFTPAGNDASLTYTITGTDWTGSNVISETVSGVANPSTTYTVLDYKTITSITTSGAVASTMTVGTNQICSSPWARLDEFASMAPTSIQVDGSGTVNWTVQGSLNDPNSTSNPVAKASMNWINHPDPSLVANSTVTGVQGMYASSPKYVRIVMNSNGSTTSYAAATVMQTFQK